MRVGAWWCHPSLSVAWKEPGVAVQSCALATKRQERSCVQASRRRVPVDGVQLERGLGILGGFRFVAG